ncbi:hypothetical protein VKT23_009919 [Stygiomarasmius scandens]|uniref:Uncharacterized protein n=1 Tax=Marasmiellus scandens TaxID=2682957 RepID=A0ABR1J1K6_9AGAR
MITMGICPRDWQMASFYYDSFGSIVRGFKIVKETVVLCYPLAKQVWAMTGSGGERQYAAFWSLLPELGKHHLFLLGVVREVQQKLLNDMNLLETPGLTETLSRQIYVSFTHLSVKNRRFSLMGKNINEIMGNTDLGLLPRELRHVQTAIINHFAPHLSSPQHKGEKSEENTQATTPVNKQAQHSDMVGDHNYAVDHLVDGVGFPEHEAQTQMLISSTMADLAGIVEKGTAQAIQSLNYSDTIKRNGDKALHAARQYVAGPEGYNMVNKCIGKASSLRGMLDLRHSAAQKIVAQECQQLLQDKPYFIKNKSGLGDDGLVRVTAALADGFILEKEDAIKVTYSTHVVAQAVYFLELALREWETGLLTYVNYKADPNLHRWVENVAGNLDLWRSQKDNKQHWIMFRENVDAVILGASLKHRQAPSFSSSAYTPGIFAKIGCSKEDIAIDDEPEVAGRPEEVLVPIEDAFKSSTEIQKFANKQKEQEKLLKAGKKKERK